jgi:cysteinyl-tRNA synthetase
VEHGVKIVYLFKCTDIDDKIIKRARQEHLFNTYGESTLDIQKITSDVSQALDEYVKATLDETDPDKKTMRERSLEKIREVMDCVEKAIKESPDDQDLVSEQRQVLLEGSRDVMYDWLDKKRPQDQIFDNDVFAQFARKWENEYFKDMTALNVLPPDVLTRVSEYVPEIVDYIVKIIDNGYAYESNGSVYFDVLKYKNSSNHSYAKLVPEAVGDMKILMEGEGNLI